MTIEDFSEGKIITLSKAFDTRPKILNFIYFIVFTISGVFLVGKVVSDGFLSLIVETLMLLFLVAYLFCAYRFLSKALQSEKLIVTRETLSILKTGFLSKSKNDYETNRISKFTHLEKPEMTRHPLAGQTFDYMGFQTEQQVINELHGDARLSFEYDGNIVTFGENIYTWDFEELEILLYDITGNDFRYNDTFEKTFLGK